MELQFDLGDYARRFSHALNEKYGSTFSEGFSGIEQRFRDIRTGARDLSVDDVVAIFDDSLPFVRDWTKPDRDELDGKMNGRKKPVAILIRELRDVPAASDGERRLMIGTIDCFRELSLTALVLHHVYPNRYAMCSHHIASLLHVTGGTVTEFYLAYCKELSIWANRRWPTPSRMSVVNAEYALWTWYRLAFSGGKDLRDHEQHRDRFYSDAWIQRRRASRIKSSLGTIGKLDLARSYLPSAPTVAAIVAWRELEVAIRVLIGPNAGERDSFATLVKKLSLHQYPRGMGEGRLFDLWAKRNRVMHHGDELPTDAADASDIVAGVTQFVSHRDR